MLRHSLTRSLIPFQIRSTAPRAALHRQVLERFPSLVGAHFQALSDIPCPNSDRDALAKAFQLVLDPHVPQRDVRNAYLEAEDRLRFSYLQRENFEVRDPRCSLLNPYTRLLYQELIGVATYYGMLYGIDGDGSLELKAGTLLKTYLTGEMRKDSIFTTTSLQYEAIDRKRLAGIRSGTLVKREQIDVVNQEVLACFPEYSQRFVTEMFLFERDVLGKHRFDFRGDKHLIFQSLIVSDIGHDENTCLFLYDPLVLKDGHFDVERTPVKNGRWNEYKVLCKEEDHRLFTELPNVLEMEEEPLFIPSAAAAFSSETSSRGPSTSSLCSSSASDDKRDDNAMPGAYAAAAASTTKSGSSFFVSFNLPLAERNFDDIALDAARQALQYGQIFETANIDNSQRTFIERLFARE